MSYDPAEDALLRYPDWVIAEADLGGIIPEVMSPSRKVILLEHRHNAAVRRCSLAHAIAHLDLGHHHTLAGWFEKREEAQADDLAARRLVPLEALAHALAWTRSRDEIAVELEVDLPTLDVRERGLTTSDRRRLRALLHKISAVA